MPLLGSILTWLLILALAIANGTLRETVLIPALGRTAGLFLSGILLSCLIALVAYAFVRTCQPLTAAQGLLLGAIWLCLTVVFEFGFGSLVQHKSWGEMMDAYTFEDGNIWPVVLLVTFLAPAVAAWLRGRSMQGTRKR
jgi:hypothetical protein